MVGHRIIKIDVVKSWKMNWKVDARMLVEIIT